MSTTTAKATDKMIMCVMMRAPAFAVRLGLPRLSPRETVSETRLTKAVLTQTGAAFVVVYKIQGGINFAESEKT